MSESGRKPVPADRKHLTKAAAVATATLGGLAVPSGAHAMLPVDGGGAPPTDDRQPDADPKPGPPAKPVARDPAPPARRSKVHGSPVRQPAPATQQQQHESPEPRQEQGERVRSEAQRYANALDQIDADDGAMRTGTAQAMQLGDDPRVRRRARRIRDRETPEPQVQQADPQPQQPQQPQPEPQPQRAQGEELRSEAERYANALDQIDADDGAMRSGTAQAMQLGDDPRVVRRAKRIRDREADALEAQQERRRQRDIQEAEDARVLRQGRAYMNAQEQIKDNGGALNKGLSRALQYGQDPKVDAFVTEFQRQLAERREDVRERERRAAVRSKAETYLNTLAAIEQRDGAMSMGLSNNLRLAGDAEVKRVADRIAANREAAEERERVMDRARTYLDGDPGSPSPRTPTCARRSTTSSSGARRAMTPSATPRRSTRSTATGAP